MNCLLRVYVVEKILGCFQVKRKIGSKCVTGVWYKYFVSEEFSVEPKSKHITLASASGYLETTILDLTQHSGQLSHFFCFVCDHIFIWENQNIFSRKRKTISESSEPAKIFFVRRALPGIFRLLIYTSMAPGCRDKEVLNLLQDRPGFQAGRGKIIFWPQPHIIARNFTDVQSASKRRSRGRPLFGHRSWCEILFYVASLGPTLWIDILVSRTYLMLLRM